MENINILKHDSKFEKANDSDSGYDIIAISDPEVKGEPCYEGGNIYEEINYIQYRTGIYLEPQSEFCYFLLYPRSSISKYNLQLANSVGVIDTSYRGEVLVRFNYLWQPKDLRTGTHHDSNFFTSRFTGVCINEERIYKKGDKIAQLIPSKNIPCNIHVVDTLTNTKRSSGGFGSTGK